jgi:hypothetical protein
MLIYHPKNDIYNCMYRLISIAKLLPKGDFSVTRLRIYDFFFLFPHLALDISFPRIKGVSQLKKQANCFQIPYEKLPDKKRLFSEISDYHIQALQILKAKRIFNFNDDTISLGESFYFESVQNLFNDNAYITNDFFSQLINTLENVDISGEKGLKARTGLMEFRYDAV